MNQLLRILCVGMGLAAAAPALAVESVDISHLEGREGVYEAYYDGELRVTGRCSISYEQILGSEAVRAQVELAPKDSLFDHFEYVPFYFKEAKLIKSSASAKVYRGTRDGKVGPGSSWCGDVKSAVNFKETVTIARDYYEQKYTYFCSLGPIPTDLGNKIVYRCRF